MNYFYFYLWIIFSIILEPFPISSSSHAQALFMFLGQKKFFYDQRIVDALEYVMHGPIALMISIFFFKRWFFLVHNIRRSWPLIIKILWLGIITESVTLFFYLFFLWSDVHWFSVTVGFLITSLSLYSLRFCQIITATSWHWSNALILGAVQGIAFLPGISRFGLTFTAARWLGFSTKKSFELSFLIEFPISVAACALGLWKLYAYDAWYLLNSTVLLIMLIASLVGVIGLYSIAYLITLQRLWLFSWYTFFISITTALIFSY